MTSSTFDPENMKIQREFQRNAQLLSQHNSEVITYRLNDYVFFWLWADDELEYVEVYDCRGNDCGYFYIDHCDEHDFEQLCALHLQETGD